MSFTSVFEPGGDAETALVTAIDAMMGWIMGLITQYQSGPIHDALIRAKVRGLDVALVFDRKLLLVQDPRLLELEDAGIIVMIDRHCKSIRSQYLISNYDTVITGTYQWTIPYGTRYASDLLIILDWEPYLSYETDWWLHYDHSDLY